MYPFGTMRHMSIQNACHHSQKIICMLLFMKNELDCRNLSIRDDSNLFAGENDGAETCKGSILFLVDALSVRVMLKVRAINTAVTLSSRWMRPLSLETEKTTSQHRHFVGNEIH